MKPAVFLDRDGTIIEQVHHLADPAHVRLLPTAGRAFQLLRDAGFACVLVSNQSAVGRGILSLEGLSMIHKELCRQLADEGAAIDGWYFCTEVPVSTDRTRNDHPDRKPAPGMLLRAAQELNLDVPASWMVGDMISDVLAGRNAGCRGSILVRTGYGAAASDAAALADHVADDLLGAVEWILSRPGPETSAPLSAPRAESSTDKGTA